MIKKIRSTFPGGITDLTLSVYTDPDLLPVTGTPFAASETAIPEVYETDDEITLDAGDYFFVWRTSQYPSAYSTIEPKTVEE